MDKTSKKILTWIVGAIVAASFIYVLVDNIKYRIKSEPIIVIDTIVMYDTSYIYRCDTVTEIKLKNVVTKVPFLVHDTTIVYPDDTIFVNVERTQKHYHQDSIADIWVSGVETELDSAHIINRTIVEKHFIKEAEYFNSAGAMIGTSSASAYYQRSVGNRLQFGAFAGSSYDGNVQFGVSVGIRF